MSQSPVDVKKMTSNTKATTAADVYLRNDGVDNSVDDGVDVGIACQHKINK